MKRILPDLRSYIEMDMQDPLRAFRDRFYIPQEEGKPLVYLCGNSLGLQPKSAEEQFRIELESWKNYGVEGHFKGKNPWVSFHKSFAAPLARLTGALPTEVVAMNSLTANLHFLMASFYKPSRRRTKIIIEGNAFSSDIYAIKSQMRFHQIDPNKNLIELQPRKGEYALRTEDIILRLNKLKGSVALLLMGGVNYYTGQAYDMELITKAAKKNNIVVGFDLAHAIGNIPLQLHKWNVDFAVWCSYKYLNAGPGATGGAFIHEKHAKNAKTFRLAGWWGNRETDRFLMKPDFKPSSDADAWQVSNAPVFNMLALKSSLQLFDEAGMKNLLKKSRTLTLILETLIKKSAAPQGYKIKIITPGSIEERGCQLSILVKEKAEELYQKIIANGFVVDFRSPNVIRVAPVPLYNTFEEVYRFAEFINSTCVYKD